MLNGFACVILISSCAGPYAFTRRTPHINSAQFSPDARLAVSGGDDKVVKLWDVANQRHLQDFVDHSGHVNKVMFNEDGTCIASCSADRTVKLWDTRSYQLLQHYPAHDDNITSISMHASGYYMMSSSADSTMKIWDLREGQLLYTLHGHEGAVNNATFSPNGNFFASGGADKMVMVWKSNLSTYVGGSAGGFEESLDNGLRARYAPCFWDVLRDAVLGVCTSWCGAAWMECDSCSSAPLKLRNGWCGRVYFGANREQGLLLWRSFGCNRTSHATLKAPRTAPANQQASAAAQDRSFEPAAKHCTQ